MQQMVPLGILSVHKLKVKPKEINKFFVTSEVQRQYLFNLFRLRERQLQPSSHHMSIAITVCWSERLSISWIACNLSSMPLLGCCATGENMTMLHRSSVMFYTGSQFPFELSSRSACWSTSRFMGRLL